MSPYVRTVKTASGATAVQIVHSSRRGSRDIEHLGSAHDDAELELLKAAARQRLAAGQGELDLGLERRPAGGRRRRAAADHRPRGWAACWMPWSAPTGCWGSTGPPARTRCSAQLVLARIIEPVSKLDSAAGAGGGRRRAGVVPDRHAPAARLCEGLVAAADLRGLRRARGAGPGEPGPLRRVHAVFRDRCGRRVPRERVLQGAAAGAADHHRAAHRPGRVPADGVGASRGTRPRPRRCCR